MAKPISFTKRDLEKKKQEKRLAKQQKKEERKNSGTSSFEDMIAYVDENGVITDTPPTTNEKPQEIDISTIEVSTPRKTDEPVITEYEGRVEFFNTSKGYGFIKNLKNAEKYFFQGKAYDEDGKAFEGQHMKSAAEYPEFQGDDYKL